MTTLLRVSLALIALVVLGPVALVLIVVLALLVLGVSLGISGAQAVGRRRRARRVWARQHRLPVTAEDRALHLPPAEWVALAEGPLGSLLRTGYASWGRVLDVTVESEETGESVAGFDARRTITTVTYGWQDPRGRLRLKVTTGEPPWGCLNRRLDSLADLNVGAPVFMVSSRWRGRHVLYRQHLMVGEMGFGGLPAWRPATASSPAGPLPPPQPPRPVGPVRSALRKGQLPPPEDD